jgi:hypothetical protein
MLIVLMKAKAALGKPIADQEKAEKYADAAIKADSSVNIESEASNPIMRCGATAPRPNPMM